MPAVFEQVFVVWHVEDCMLADPKVNLLRISRETKSEKAEQELRQIEGDVQKAGGLPKSGMNSRVRSHSHAVK